MMGLVFMFVFLIATLIIVLVLPIWAIIDCAISLTRSAGSKAFFIVLILFTWTLGAIIYGIFSTSSRILRKISIFAVIFYLVLCIVLAASPDIRKKFVEKMRSQSSQQANYPQ